jgi:hypothetical protein
MHTLNKDLGQLDKPASTPPTYRRRILLRRAALLGLAGAGVPCLNYQYGSHLNQPHKSPICWLTL